MRAGEAFLFIVTVAAVSLLGLFALSKTDFGAQTFFRVKGSVGTITPTPTNPIAGSGIGVG